MDLDKDALEAAAAELQQLDLSHAPQIITHVTDICCLESMNALFNDLDQLNISLDVLVNNAGVMSPIEKIHESDPYVSENLYGSVLTYISVAIHGGRPGKSMSKAFIWQRKLFSSVKWKQIRMGKRSCISSLPHLAAVYLHAQDGQLIALPRLLRTASSSTLSQNMAIKVSLLTLSTQAP